MGISALFSNLNGSENIAIGNNAMYNAASPQYSVAIGYYAAGASVNQGPGNPLINPIGGDFNVAIGYQALKNYPGQQNVAIGYNSGYSASGYNNVSIGSGALTQSIGNGNTAIGSNSGIGLGVGSNNTYIGNGTGTTSHSLSGVIIIGNSSTVTTTQATQNNQIVIGNSGHTASATQIAGANVNLGAWVPYSPSIVMGTSGTFAIGNGSMFFYYCQIGKTVHFRGQITTGTTTTFGVGYIGISFPVPISSNLIANFPIGITQWRQNAGTTWAGNIVVNSVGNNNFVLRAPQTGSSASGQITTWTNAAPLGQATGDTWSWQGTYESA